MALLLEIANRVKKQTLSFAPSWLIILCLKKLIDTGFVAKSESTSLFQVSDKSKKFLALSSRKEYK